jgi:hypothetical protein
MARFSNGQLKSLAQAASTVDQTGVNSAVLRSVVSTVSGETLARGFQALTRNDDKARWRWAHQVSAFKSGLDRAVTGRASSVSWREAASDLGRKCAEQVGRVFPVGHKSEGKTRAYSAQLIDAYVRGATAFPAEPTTAAEWERFRSIVNLETKEKGKNTKVMTPADYYKAALGWARKGVTEGGSWDEFIDLCVTERDRGLCEEGDADAE